MTNQKTRKQQNNLKICLAVLIAIITINCSKITTASEDLIGIWKATDIRYSNTHFEIEKETITFQTKEGDRNSYTIIEIKKEPMQDGQWVQYTIFYKDPGLHKVEFPFYLYTSEKSMIRFKNQPNLVWKKEVGIAT